MKNPRLADFHHGWIIEVVHHESGFQSTCYSPSRKRIQDISTYTCEQEAFNAAKKLISRHTACYSLATTLRELFELNKLEFEEWCSLNQSLREMAIAS
jgi:hypothetical protein